MAIQSILSEADHVRRAVHLIKLGARLQVLKSETDLSYERLLRLYKEVRGKGPSKGQLPFSTDWFMTWQPNVHSSLFLNIYQNLIKSTEIDDIDAMTKAYELYLEQVKATDNEIVLSVTRAWRLVRFVDAQMLTLCECTRCGGQFVNHTHELTDGYVCGLCNPPARAGKSRSSRSSELGDDEQPTLH